MLVRVVIDAGASQSTWCEPTCQSRRPPYPITYNHCRSRVSDSGRRGEKRVYCPLGNLDTQIKLMASRVSIVGIILQIFCLHTFVTVLSLISWNTFETVACVDVTFSFLAVHGTHQCTVLPIDSRIDAA